MITTWKVSRALDSPNGTAQNSYKPSWICKIVLGISSSLSLSEFAHVVQVLKETLTNKEESLLRNPPTSIEMGNSLK